MTKHNFKIGDRVKVKEPQYWSMNTRIGTVVGEDEYYINVTYEGGGTLWKNYPHLPREIEHVIKKGEQLMFSFMGG